MCKTATSLNVWKERIMSTFARGRCMSKTATSVNAWKERVWQRLAEVAACVAAKYIYIRNESGQCLLYVHIMAHNLETLNCSK